MKLHAARAACLAGGALLAAAALRTVHAEAAYEAGLALAPHEETPPFADVPGRLERYETALRRDPWEGLYALRAAQIRLRRPSAREPAERERIDALLAHARALRPSDAEVHAEMGRAARAAGDPAAAAANARRALRLAPRGAPTLASSATLGLWAWRAASDPAHLRVALEAGASLREIGSGAWGPRFREAFGRGGAGLAADVEEAAAGDPRLRAFAQEAARAANPALAAALGVSEDAR